MELKRPDLFESFLAAYEEMEQARREEEGEPVPVEEAGNSPEEEPKEEPKPEEQEENDFTLTVAEAVEEATKAPKEPTESDKENKDTVNHRILQDFGHKIGGARKDAYAAYYYSLQEAAARKVEKFTLSANWPAPNYQKLLDGGVDPWKVSAIRALRDSCAARPKRLYHVFWENDIIKKRNLAVGVLQDEYTEETFKGTLWNWYLQEYQGFGVSQDKWDATDCGSEQYVYAITQYELYQAMGHKESLKDFYIGYNRRGSDIWKDYSLLMHVSNADFRKNEDAYKELFDLDNTVWYRGKSGGYIPITRNRKSIQELIPALKEVLLMSNNKEEKDLMQDDKEDKKKKKDEMHFKAVYTDKGYSFWGKVGKGRFLQLTEPIDRNILSDYSKAEAYMKEHYDELKEKLVAVRHMPEFRYDKNQPRTGKARSHGDITPEDYMKTFGFYGVEFGNWVEGKTRQENLNRSYDALLDLADALNLPPKALSLGGTLSLRFGSNGHGGRRAPAAHYEPGLKAINLTKRNGAGCLAHEWFHAIDNYLGGKDHTEMFSETNSIRYVSNLLRHIGTITDEYGESQPAYLINNSKNLIDEKIKDAQKNFESKPDVYPVRFDVRMGMAKAVRACLHQSGMQTRGFGLDGPKRKPYWGTTIEIMARSFEAYVKHALEEKGIQNDFLVNIRSEKDWMKATNNLKGYPYPYPKKEELPVIEKGFQALFSSLKTHELDNGKVELFSCSNHETLGHQIEESRLIPKGELTQKERDFTAFAEKELQLDIRYFDGPESLHGKCQQDTLYLNRKSEKPLRWTFYHEAFHSMKHRDPKLYNDLLTHVETKGIITDKQIDAFRKSHHALDMPRSTVKEELLANAFADIQQEAHIVNQIAREKLRLAARALTFARRLAQKTKAFFQSHDDTLSMKQTEALEDRLKSIANEMRIDGQTPMADKNFVLGLDNLPMFPDNDPPRARVQPFLGNKAAQHQHDVSITRRMLQKFTPAICEEVLATCSPLRKEPGYARGVIRDAQRNTRALAY